MTRSFEDKPAVRSQVPLMIGLVGPSGGGKTFSALRLATGIQRVSGGDIFYIDTEARRALHYADRFTFRHLEFGAPFGALDYLAAIEHCVKKGAGVVVIDSMSHEHEGPGGLLEQQEAEVTRMAGDDYRKRERVKMLAWQKPKAARTRLINSVLQMSANFIFCFRAKEKMKIVKGKDPEPLGFMPIAGPEFVYEMTMNALLLPNAGGVPTWQSDEVGERKMIKRPEQFRQLFSKQRPLDEDAGETMARWAAGDAAPELPDVDSLVARYGVCSDMETHAALEGERRQVWTSATGAQKAALKKASDESKARAEAAPADDFDSFDGEEAAQ